MIQGGFTQGPWRPPQWSDQSDVVYARTSVADTTTEYFFDAIIRIDHESALKITEHPIQTGANISDHAYQLPTRLVMEIRMSDAMDSIVQNQFQQATTKSVSAYQTLLAMQAAITPLTIVTRLNVYTNMLIENITAPDDIKTLWGLKAIVVFRQLFTVEVSTEVVSARQQASKQTPGGVAFPEQPTQQTTMLYDVQTNLSGGQ